MNHHPIVFTAPQPFWRPGSAEATGSVARPQILRFANDEFIEELLATLEREPAQLVRYAAQPETWRSPMRGAPASDPTQWLERKPARLLPLLRRARARTAPPTATPPAADPLKLYQPAHQRHYLVAASLVCQTPGLPDRAVDVVRQQLGCVVRRLLPHPSVTPPAPLPQPRADELSGWDEYAWVLAGKSGQWQRVGAAGIEAQVARTLPGEERLSTFPARFAQPDGQPRKLVVGSIPVGRREVYQGAQQLGGDGETPPPDPRLVMFRMQVLGPWKAMVAAAMGNGEPGDAPTDLAALRAARLERVFQRVPEDESQPATGCDPTRPGDNALRTERSRLQTASWLLLADLMAFMHDQMPDFWNDQVLAGVPLAAGPLRDFHDALGACAMPAGLAGPGRTLATVDASPELSLAQQCPGYGAGVVLNLLDALRRAAQASIGGLAFAEALDAAANPLALPSSGRAAGWPDFLFLFADPWFGILAPPVPPGFQPTTADYLSERIVALIDTLADRLEAALAVTPDSGAPVPEPALASIAPADLREAWYLMRFVHERPECAPFESAVVSRATVPFQMAGFFDPDAPARPIRIGLPLDISPAGLRKFDRNAVFMMSDMLCGHIDRFKGITFADLVLSVLPFPFHKELSVPDKGPCKSGGLELGVMCSLSIPIITICALILLMIIVTLLDAILRWLPLFVVCFPLPGFKGKKP